MLGQTGDAVAARRRRKAQKRQNARGTLEERQKGLLPVSCPNVVQPSEWSECDLVNAKSLRMLGIFHPIAPPPKFVYKLDRNDNNQP